jgi:hypothetical protein
MRRTGMAVVGIIEMVAVGVTMTGSQKDFVDVACKLRPHDARTNGKSHDRRAVAAAAGVAERTAPRCSATSPSALTRRFTELANR